MAPGTHTANKARASEGVDWLALFPTEQTEKPGALEGPAREDPFELFPRETRLLEPPPMRLLDPPPVVPVRHLRAVPQPAVRILVEPSWPVWRLPEIQLSEFSRTMILTGVAAFLLIVFVRTRLPLMPDVPHAIVLEQARAIDIPSFALAPPKGIRPAARSATTGQTLPIATAQTSLAARLSTPPEKPGATPTRSAGAIAPRSGPATAAITPPAATFGADVNAGSPLTPEPARVPDVTPTLVPAVLTAPAPPPARVTDPATVRASDTAAIESVLGRYRNAYTALNMGEVQRVWPQVDRRALERSFSEVDENALQFDDCRIDITGRDARAACSGSARSLPKGSTRPKLESRRWDFTLSKIGTDWLILSAQTRR